MLSPHSDRKSDVIHNSMNLLNTRYRHIHLYHVLLCDPLRSGKLVDKPCSASIVSHQLRLLAFLIIPCPNLSLSLVTSSTKLVWRVHINIDLFDHWLQMCYVFESNGKLCVSTFGIKQLRGVRVIRQWLFVDRYCCWHIFWSLRCNKIWTNFLPFQFWCCSSTCGSNISPHLCTYFKHCLWQHCWLLLNVDNRWIISSEISLIHGELMITGLDCCIKIVLILS